MNDNGIVSEVAVHGDITEEAISFLASILYPHIMEDIKNNDANNGKEV